MRGNTSRWGPFPPEIASLKLETLSARGPLHTDQFCSDKALTLHNENFKWGGPNVRKTATISRLYGPWP